MILTQRQVKSLMYVIEGTGAIFVSLFITVYVAGLGSLPSDVVYHSQPAFRTPLSIIGVALIALALVALLISIYVKRTNE